MTDKQLEARDWSEMDGATVWHLIDRQADGWADVGRMMDEYVAAKIEADRKQRGEPTPEAEPSVIELDGCPKETT